MVSISVIQATYRLGGIDLLFDTLARQSFQDYELILVDEWAEQRRDVVAQYAKRMKVNLKCHISPKKKEEHGAISNAFNTAYIYADGELVVGFNDYQYGPPTWLQRHWEVYTEFDKKFTANGFCYWHKSPPLLDTSIAQNIYISTFTHPPSLDVNISDLPISYKERYGNHHGPMVISPVSGTYPSSLYIFSGRLFYDSMNGSIPLKTLIELNGCDECYDQSSAVRDIDLGVRAEMIGHRFILDTENIVHAIDHETIDKKYGHLWKKHRKFIKPHQANIDYMAEREEVIRFIIRSPHDFELSKAREERLNIGGDTKWVNEIGRTIVY